MRQSQIFCATGYEFHTKKTSWIWFGRTGSSINSYEVPVFKYFDTSFQFSSFDHGKSMLKTHNIYGKIEMFLSTKLIHWVSSFQFKSCYWSCLFVHQSNYSLHFRHSNVIIHTKTFAKKPACSSAVRVLACDRTETTDGGIHCNMQQEAFLFVWKREWDRHVKTYSYDTSHPIWSTCCSVERFCVKQQEDRNATNVWIIIRIK